MKPEYELYFVTPIEKVKYPDDDNIDVEVNIEGVTYFATFITTRNIETILFRYARSGECAQGMYFWASNIIIIKSICESTIRKTIEDLIKSGEFYKAFSV